MHPCPARIAQYIGLKTYFDSPPLLVASLHLASLSGAPYQSLEALLKYQRKTVTELMRWEGVH